ncbi:MAG: ABC transporter substrate-binding protein [Desulfobacterales bacterium]|nr:ABC transporter substrate-binding protein [Desulfobacterales bacterium]MBF0396534.1 ABC transporter substrate-binding protein [Desulfobacterales bacterium]
MTKRCYKTLLLAAIIICFSAFSVMAEEGVTDTEIHIGQTGPLSGPAAAWSTVSKGAGLLFKMVNEEGGIAGRKIVYHVYDDSYNPAKTKAGVKQLQETAPGIFAWVGGVGTATGLAVLNYLVNKNVPWVGMASGSDAWVTPPQKNIFSVYPHYQIEARSLCKYAIDTLGKKKIAIAYQNDPYGQSGLKGASEAISKYNLQLAATVPVEKENPNLKETALALRNSGAEVVFLWLTPFSALRIIQESKSMKFEPQWMSSSTFSDFPQLYNLSKGLIKGLIAATFFDFKSSLMEKYKEAKNKLSPEDEWGIFYIGGIGFAEPLVEGLKRCGKELTKDKFIAEMEKMQNFKGLTGAITYAPFDASNPSCRQGLNKVLLVECLEGGESKVLTDWME